MTNQDDIDDWCVECSDEEKYGHEGIWEPDAKDIVELYQKLAKGESLDIEWKSKGRKPLETTPVKSDDREETVEAILNEESAQDDHL